MSSSESHHLLFCEASVDENSDRVWRFVLEDMHGRRRLVASDAEPSACRERLELLALVRGLEALDGRANVTLVTKSRYVDRGLKRGLAEWRSNEWLWERFGKLVPVRDQDLWQRVDRALQFHQLQCRLWRFDEQEAWASADHHADAGLESPRAATPTTRRCDDPPTPQRRRLRRPARRRLLSAAKSQLAGATRKAAALGERLVAGDGLAAG